MLEERRARPGWGADAPMGSSSTYAGGRLPPVSRHERWFMRPRFGEQMILATTRRRSSAR